MSTATIATAMSGLLRSARGRAMQLIAAAAGRGRYDRLVLEEVGGRPLLVLPQVFNPRLMRTGAMLAEALDERLVPPGCRALDMGTGSGAGAVAAARWAARVVAVDVNPEAVRCARINALLSRVEDRVEVRQGDLFAPVAGERFDVVLFNPPFFRGRASGLLDHAWRSEDTVERFAAALPAHLAEGGRALVLLSSAGEEPAFLEAFRAAGFAPRPLLAQRYLDERFTIYSLGGA